MSLTLFDFILLGIMVISGLLALMRGFTREVLSLVAWGLAAVATYFALKQPKLITWTSENIPYLDKEIFAKIGLGAAVFILVLIIVSVISVKISDYVVDSSAGAFDRTMGFLFGLARGFVFVAIAYLFYGWLLPFDKQEPWVRTAASLPVIKSTGEALLALMPPDIAETLSNTALLKNPGQTGEAPADTPPEPGYKNNETQGLDNLIEGTGGNQQPTFGQSVNQ
ncbi:MAG: CvpA family protein [Alphaproteobacteria bacterium]|nr:CvpA family protein [Alphaproteobacteria bacterium]